jgi:hypothetical protein
MEGPRLQNGWHPRALCPARMSPIVVIASYFALVDARWSLIVRFAPIKTSKPGFLGRFSSCQRNRVVSSEDKKS